MRVMIDDTYLIEYWNNNIVVKKQRARQEIPVHLQKHIKGSSKAEENPFVEEVVGYYANLESALMYGFFSAKLNSSGTTTIVELKELIERTRKDILAFLENNKALKRYPKTKKQKKASRTE